MRRRTRNRSTHESIRNIDGRAALESWTTRPGRRIRLQMPVVGLDDSFEAKNGGPRLKFAAPLEGDRTRGTARPLGSSEHLAKGGYRCHTVATTCDGSSPRPRSHPS